MFTDFGGMQVNPQKQYFKHMYLHPALLFLDIISYLPHILFFKKKHYSQGEALSLYPSMVQPLFFPSEVIILMTFIPHVDFYISLNVSSTVLQILNF